MSTAAVPPLPLGFFASSEPCRPGLPAFPEGRPESTPPAPRPATTPSLPVFSDEPVAESPEFTDDDLREALAPFVTAPATASAGLPDDFEALLRTALRRTLAEHARGPFEEPDVFLRLRWRLDALFSSRSYEEVVETRTHRFHVEECYLLDDERFSVISYASANPSRHLHPRRVAATAGRLSSSIRALNAREHIEFQHVEFTFGKELRAIVRMNHGTALVAMVRGRPDADTVTDLDCIHRRIHDRFGDRIHAGEPLLDELQPLLEECLLIHAPLAPVAR